MSELLFLRPSQLRLHPENMRRVYPAYAVDEMASSIKANNGVIQPLEIVPDPDRPGCYLVVDGNMRLAAGQHLGSECPDLKCEVIDAGHAEQLLLMVVTSAFHYPKDPISEGQHYKRLIDEGYTVAAIARHTGLSQNVILSRLRWLELEPEIRDHVAAGALSKDKRVADALLTIPDKPARVQMAAKLADRRASIETCVTACEKLAEQIRERDALKAHAAPAVAITGAARNTLPADWQTVRSAVAAACEACNIHQDELAAVAEPAWELITHAATDTCQSCNLRDLRSLCGECPVVEFLLRLQKIVTEDGVPVAMPVLALTERRNGRN